MDDQIQIVIDAFQLQTNDIKAITNRLYKINTGNQLFALKKSRLQTKDVGKWQAIYQTLHQFQIQGFISLYYSRDQVPYYSKNNTIYYLMPWFEKEHREHPIDEYHMVAHALGKLHATTMVSDSISSYKQNRSFSIYQHKQEIEDTQKKMLECVRYFEAKRFMAPHELQICMYYKDIENIIFYLFQWYDIYLEQATETKQVKNTLCHGNINASHYIMKNEMVYFLNWESASRTIPTVDLANYYHHLFQYQDCDLEKVADSYHVYCQYMDLSDYEKANLTLQLLSLTTWIQLMEECIRIPSRESSIQLAINIEQEHRKLLFSLQFQEVIYHSLKINQSQNEALNET